MMQLIALTGLAAHTKRDLTLYLAEHWHQDGLKVALLDNNDLPVGHPGDYTLRRLAGGCVCCSLAAQLIPSVQQISADRVVLPVSMQADPEALSMVLAGLGIPYRIVTVLDAAAQQRAPYLSSRLQQYADLIVHQQEAWDACLHL